MAEEINTIAPVIETVPTVTPTETTATVEAPVTTTTETVETPVTTATTILGEAPVQEVKPVETPVAESTVTETPKDEKGQSEEPAPPPVFEKFVVPDDIQLDDGLVKEFTDTLSELEVKAKAEHALVQEFGQKAVDFHLKEVKKAQDSLLKFYTTEWENQKIKWKEDFLADPDLGGNRFQTTLDAANDFIRTHGGTTDQQAEFRKLMDSSGLGNNKVIIRMLANAGRATKEGRPLAAPTPVSLPKTKTETLYGSKK